MGTFYTKTHLDNIFSHDSQWGYRNGLSRAPSAYRRTISSASYADARNCNAQVQSEYPCPNGDVLITNRLHADFVKALGDASSFGATLTAEGRQTFSMLSSTVLRLFQAARCVRKLDFAGCARHLGIPYRERTITTTRGVGSRIVRGRKRPARYIRSRRRVFTLPTGREVQKSLANGWLLWSYGVKPLAQDIYNGLDVLQRPLDYRKPVRVFAKELRGTKSEVIAPTWNNYGSSTNWSGSVSGACGAMVSVSNPNAYLLNKMGFANPAMWVLEAIPFSFVVDWFSNLSQVVGQFNEYSGYSIEATWMSKRYHYSRSFSYFGPYGYSGFEQGYVFHRTTSLPTPTLVFAYERFGLQRALNAISLLVGILPRK